METPTPEKPAAEEAEKAPGPSEHISIHFKTHAHRLPGQSAHHEGKSESPADVTNRRQDPGDPPDAEGQSR